MMTRDQAWDIVARGVRETTGRGVSAGDRLVDAGITSANLDSLARRLAEAPGVRAYQASANPGAVANLHPGMSVDDLVDQVVRLSAGKLCSNNPPHEQPYPAPSVCWCGSSVL